MMVMTKDFAVVRDAPLKEYHRRTVNARQRQAGAVTPEVLNYASLNGWALPISQ